METLTGSAPTARVQALFPYLEAFRERAAELKEQFERQTMPNGRELGKCILSFYSCAAAE